MTKKLSLIAALGIAGIFSSSLMAQMTPQRVNHKKLLADNISALRQAQLLDSIISERVRDEDEDDNPASEMYDGAWSTKGVNANRVELDKIPDSVTFDCSGYVHPIMGEITSIFGPRKTRYHYGLDIKLNVGDPVVSAWDGKVRVTSYDRKGYGSYIVIRHNNGLETVYGHLSEIKVFDGQTVRAGQIIALGGNTGRSTGPHLHFETRFLGNPINPERFIDFESGTVWRDKYLMRKDVAFEYTKYAHNSRFYASLNSRSRGESNDDKNSSSKGNHSKREKSKFHKVKNGETLSHIADRYNVSISELCRKNGISRTKLLKPGQKIKYS